MKLLKLVIGDSFSLVPKNYEFTSKSLCSCVLLQRDLCVCKSAHTQVCLCGKVRLREERIETEMEQEQRHPFKRSLLRLCPTFLFFFMGAQRRKKKGRSIKADSDVGGRGHSLLSLTTSLK